MQAGRGGQEGEDAGREEGEGSWSGVQKLVSVQCRLASPSPRRLWPRLISIGSPFPLLSPSCYYPSLPPQQPPTQVVVATPRQLESLIRLSEALARMRLDTLVTKKDVEEAVRLWYTAMQVRGERR